MGSGWGRRHGGDSAHESVGIADVLGLVGILLVAAALRLPDLATRGMWDADQGHDMLVLRALVHDGAWPLLGPPTSIGGVHHGALYYLILAPFAALGGGADPTTVAFGIALAGIVAVALTWWLARSIGGSTAGFVAGLLLAVSATAVDGSTFIWNPNLVAFGSALALAAAWRAWTTERAGWWLVAAAGAAITAQCHVLGVVLLPVLAALLVADGVRRTSGGERRALSRAAVGAVVVLFLSYLPLVLHELTTDAGETRALVAYLGGAGGNGDPTPLAFPIRLVVIGWRILAWPLTGLVTDATIPALIVAALVIAAIAWRWRTVGGEGRAVRWLGLGLAWSAAALAILSPSLATVTPGLPNDHYHAFADPMVMVLAGVGVGALATRRPGGRVTQPLALVVVVALVAWNAVHWPPRLSPDGGYPLALATARRIEQATESRPLLVASLPDFKTTEALSYPLTLDGRVVTPASPPGTLADATGARLVVICDPLFQPAIGAPCGGPAEDAWLAKPSIDLRWRLLDRFAGSPRQVISIYVSQ